MKSQSYIKSWVHIKINHEPYKTAICVTLFQTTSTSILFFVILGEPYLNLSVTFFACFCFIGYIFGTIYIHPLIPFQMQTLYSLLLLVDILCWFNTSLHLIHPWFNWQLPPLNWIKNCKIIELTPAVTEGVHDMMFRSTVTRVNIIAIHRCLHQPINN